MDLNIALDWAILATRQLIRSSVQHHHNNDNDNGNDNNSGNLRHRRVVLPTWDAHDNNNNNRSSSSSSSSRNNDHDNTSSIHVDIPTDLSGSGSASAPTRHVLLSIFLIRTRFATASLEQLETNCLVIHDIVSGPAAYHVRFVLVRNQTRGVVRLKGYILVDASDCSEAFLLRVAYRAGKIAERFREYVGWTLLSARATPVMAEGLRRHRAEVSDRQNSDDDDDDEPETVATPAQAGVVDPADVEDNDPLLDAWMVAPSQRGSFRPQIPLASRSVEQTQDPASSGKTSTDPFQPLHHDCFVTAA